MTDSNKIRLRPTIPIRGGDIEIKFGTMDNFGDLLPASCMITITPGDEPEWQDISVQAVCDNTNRAFTPSAFTFTVTSVSNEQLAPFWLFYELPPVMVSFVLPSLFTVLRHTWNKMCLNS